MPGFKSHYLFGRNTLTQFSPNQNEQYLIKYPQSFHLGLQGPDVFFYHLPSWILYKENIGNVIHHSSSTSFIDALIQARNSMINKNAKAICDAYICGFIGHYTFDTFCHPYIYYRTKNHEHQDEPLYDFGIHVFLETDIDNAMLRHYTHMKPSEFAMGSTIQLSISERTIISLLLYKAIKIAFPSKRVMLFHIRGAIKSMKILNDLMCDPTGFKKKLVRTIERFILGHAFISAMIPSDNLVMYKDPCNLRHKEWKNPWAPTINSTESIYDLSDKASKVFERRIHYYSNSNTLSRSLSNEEKTKNLNMLYEDLGDISYITGLPFKNK